MKATKPKLILGCCGLCAMASLRELPFESGENQVPCVDCGHTTFGRVELDHITQLPFRVLANLAAKGELCD